MNNAVGFDIRDAIRDLTDVLRCIDGRLAELTEMGDVAMNKLTFGNVPGDSPPVFPMTETPVVTQDGSLGGIQGKERCAKLTLSGSRCGLLESHPPPCVPARWTCGICNEYFIEEAAFRQHMDDHAKTGDGRVCQCMKPQGDTGGNCAKCGYEVPI